MEYNIDILVAGCNTTCMHCYVNGGKAPEMSISDFCLCLKKLGPVFDKLGQQISFTLDNEIFNHTNAVEILECVEQNCKSNYYHHGSTTGIAFLTHPQQDKLIDILKRNKWDTVSFAIHGNEETHNKIVNNNCGLQCIVDASKLFKEHNFEIWISIMISKKLVSELEELSDILARIESDNILPVIPDYLPIPRLMKYQNLRCNKNEFAEILGFLIERKIDVSSVKSAVESFNEQTILETTTDESIKEELTRNNTAFFHIDNKLDFYLGNTGSPLKHLGNIKDLSSDEIYQCIVDAEDNYYETATIHYSDIVNAVANKALKSSTENYVYPSRIAGIIAMMKNI